MSQHEGKGETAMKSLQVPEVKMLVKVYQNGDITLKELMEELECYWDKKLYKGTKTPILDEKALLVQP
jgi:hypothetical protein